MELPFKLTLTQHTAIKAAQAEADAAKRRLDQIMAECGLPDDRPVMIHGDGTVTEYTPQRRAITPANNGTPEGASV